MDVLDEDPLKVEGTEPLAWFPPVLEGGIIFNIGGHFGNTQELVATDNSEN